MEMVTQQEKESLEARLAALIANRAVISKRIAEARELGDLKENGDYHAAREEQGMQEAEIRRLEQRLAAAQVVDDSHKSAGVVFVGAMVKIREEGGDEIEMVRLVGEATGEVAADFFEATVQSPFGEALLKARVGEVISVRGPRGMKKFEIIEIV
jgi:transcription elongation factor GreA